MSEIITVPYWYGTCVRCGKTVERSKKSDRWHDQFGRDRCRADPDDGQCDVRDIHQGARPAKVIEEWWAVVTLAGPDGQEIERQEVLPGGSWEHCFTRPREVLGFRISSERRKRQAQLAGDELAAWQRDNPQWAELHLEVP